MMKKNLFFLLLILTISISTYLMGLTQQQIISSTVFLMLIAGALLFWRFRLVFALLGLSLLLGFGLIDVPHLIEFAGLDIILFLVGMMIVIGFLEERRFFENIVESVMRFVGNDAKKLVIALMLMSGLFAALVDEVTSILFMAATVLYITGRYGVNPIPFIIMIVFATNIGSSATVVGNPVGVMIALRGGLTFSDFLRWATPISVIALFLTILLSLRCFAAEIEALSQAMKQTAVEEPKTVEQPTTELEVERTIKRRGMAVSWALFLVTISSLILHHQIEELLHLEKNTMLLGTALIASGITLFLEREGARELVERRVDWWTLTFFLILFSSVGTLKFVGVTGVVAGRLLSISGEDIGGILLIFSIVAAVLSAFMDNVLAVATLIPIVQEIANLGIQSFPLWWGTLFAGTFFGNLTMIGSTANIVAVGMLERRKMGVVTLLQWIKPGAIVSIPTFALALILIYLQIPLMPK